MKTGYVRVSTEEQNTARQEVLLHELGVDEIFIDKASGKSADRPELKRMMDYVRKGEITAVQAMTQLGMSKTRFYERAKKIRK